MRSRLAMALAAAAGVALATTASAQTETVIWSFDAGSSPVGPLTLDSNTGALYGTTYGGSGGDYDGTIFSLVEKHGVWKHIVIHTFDGSDGARPWGGLVEDSVGNLYGTTQQGGASGYGTAFELSFNGSTWTYTLLHSFTGGSDGEYPMSELTIDSTTGALYGTTWSGGTQNCGTAFTLPTSGGESVLYSFQGGSADGCNPMKRVRQGPDGTLFGVTSGGGSHGYGTVFSLKESDGVWSESPIKNFSDHIIPTDLDIDGTTGILFGATAGEAGYTYGTVFKLAHRQGGWHETALYTFEGSSDGADPMGLHLDHSTGSLYGTTYGGGAYSYGTAFELTNNAGTWTETQLHSFGAPGDGQIPYARPSENTKTVTLYGTTSAGGTHGGGTAYMIAP